MCGNAACARFSVDDAGVPRWYFLARSIQRQDERLPQPVAAKHAKPGTKRDELRRAELLAAAREIFGEKGYHESTVDDITRRAGVAKGCAISVFPKKEVSTTTTGDTFFPADHHDGGRRSRRAFRDVIEFFSRMQLAGVRLFQIFHENHVLARLRESASASQRRDDARDFYRKLAEVEAENVRLGIRLGVFREVDLMICMRTHRHVPNV